VGARVITRLAVGGMLLAVIALGALAVWATIVTEEHTRGLSRAGVQTSGHLRATQAVGQIDTHTDLLEDGYDPEIATSLRTAQRELVDSLHRMQHRSVVARERELAHDAAPTVQLLWPVIDAFVEGVQTGDDDVTSEAEEQMEEILDELQLLLNDLSWDPSERLNAETAAAAAEERVVHRTALVLIPLGLAFVLLCAWQLRTYRRRSEAAMRADARTDALTGLGNRRALLEELDGRADGFALALADLNGFKHYNDSFGHTAGDALLRRLAEKLRSAFADDGLAIRLGGDEFCVVFDSDMDVDEVRARVESALAEAGDGFQITSACGVVRVPEDAPDTGGALRLADARMYAAKAGTRATVEHQMCQLLVRMLDARHPGLGTHGEEVTELAGACATELGVRSDELHDIRRAAQMHDIGKVAIPESIIEKRGPLTADEWDFIRTHTIIGERVLAGVPAMEPIATIVRSSHERWDGTGYPDRLAGHDIPIGARIVAVADAFCAMTEERPYRESRSRREAIEELRACAGTQFDPAVVDAFVVALEAAAVAPVPGA
jgi:diguanylate cyclase (GGDEF)-like protein